MTAAFPGSVLLGQDADGHATLVALSRRIARGTGASFQSGKLPTEGVGCKPDRGVFGGYEHGRKVDVEVEGKGEDIDLGMAVERPARVLGKQGLPIGVF
jgi:hypothetical protein